LIEFKRSENPVVKSLVVDEIEFEDSDLFAGIVRFAKGNLGGH